MKIRIISSFRATNPDIGRDECMWTGEIPIEPGEGTTDEINSQIYRMFNRVEKPDGRRLQNAGYTLPSLTAGDLIVWCPSTTRPRPRMFLVDTVGFAEIMPGLGLLRETLK